MDVHKGDVSFIPSGTIHAICSGILICEVQQNSNTTYRVYDYDRRGADGNATISLSEDCFRSLVILDGADEIEVNNNSVSVTKGDSVFIPAQTSEARLTGSFDAIISYV